MRQWVGYYASSLNLTAALKSGTSLCDWDLLLDTQRDRLQSLSRFIAASKMFNNLGNLLFAQKQPKTAQCEAFCHGFATVFRRP